VHIYIRVTSPNKDEELISISAFLIEISFQVQLRIFSPITCKHNTGKFKQERRKETQD